MKIPFCDYHILTLLTYIDSPGNDKKPLDWLLSEYFRAHKSLGSKDRRAIGEALYGMVRWKSLIDCLCPSSSPKDRLHQYRSMDLDTLLQDPSLPLPARLGMPDFLAERLTSCFGLPKAKDLCKILNGAAPTTIRANLLKTSREHLLSLWGKTKGASPCQYAPAGIEFPKREPLFSLPEFREGLFEMQDEGSQLIASLVDAKPGERVLDYCSGSGGKSLAFAPLMRGRGQIYLHDVRASALVQAKKRLRRAGIQNAQCLSPQHPELKKIRQKCDWVLADVPCSGTGTLRRNPDQKWGIDASMLERLIATQRTIVQEALQYVNPAGHFVYATCSLLPEENERQVEHFLASHPIELADAPLSLLPKEGGMDGFFAARFIKKKSVL